MAIDAPPNQCFAVGSDSDGVVLTTVDVDNAVVLQTESLHDLWSVDSGVVVTSSISNTGPPKAIDTPAPDSVFRVDGEGVVIASVDCFVGLQPRTKRRRIEGVLLIRARTLDNVVSKLILFSTSPGENETFVVDSHCMVGATGDIGDILEVG